MKRTSCKVIAAFGIAVALAVVVPASVSYRMRPLASHRPAVPASRRPRIAGPL